MARWKHYARDLAGELLLRSRVTRPARRLASRWTLVTFHRVLPAELRARYPFPGLVVTPEQLRWFVDFFGEHFEILPVSDAQTRMDTTSPTADARPLLSLTFDDGQLDNHRYAAPVLNASGVRATFYIPTAAVEDGQALWHDAMAFAGARALERDPAHWRNALRDAGVPGHDAPPSVAAAKLVAWAKDIDPSQRAQWIAKLEQAAPNARPDWDGMMSWEQLRELQEGGHEIGSHSVHHALLPQCTDDELRHELEHSRALLESKLQSEIPSFCYPNGSFDARVRDATQRAGYRNAVTTSWGHNGAEADALSLRRCDMQPDTSTDAQGRMSSARVAWRLSGWHPGLRG